VFIINLQKPDYLVLGAAKSKILPLLFVGLLFQSFNLFAQHTDVQQFIKVANVGEAGFNKERLSRLDSALKTYVTQGILPNVVTCIVWHGKIVHSKAFGWSNIEKKIPVSTDNIFRIASQTKAITSVALMTLYEEGKFLLDDPVSKYIPEFKNPVVLDSFNAADSTYTTHPAKGEITIRQLLTHTSGISYGILGTGPGNMIFAKEKIPAVNSLDDITIKQAVKKIARLPLMFDPGEKFLYGMNCDVIGYLIEVLSGKPLDVFVRERVLDPLGMNNTYFYLPTEKAGKLVTLYTPGLSGLQVHPNLSYQTNPVAGAKKFLSGGAGLCGTVEDYARFCQMIMNGGTFNNHRVLSRKTVDLMTLNQIGDKTFNELGNKFGLGFEIYSTTAAAHHLGTIGALKWGGMYYTDYMIDPKEDLIFVIYTNIQPYSGPNIHELVYNLIYQALE
jgi:CubicO group peptidase (beta-lactamase class C family)